MLKIKKKWSESPNAYGSWPSIPYLEPRHGEEGEEGEGNQVQQGGLRSFEHLETVTFLKLFITKKHEISRKYISYNGFLKGYRAF